MLSAAMTTYQMSYPKERYEHSILQLPAVYIIALEEIWTQMPQSLIAVKLTDVGRLH